MRLALEYLEEGLTLGRHDVWAWFLIPTRSYDLVSDEHRMAEARALALGITALGHGTTNTAECHLLVAHRPVIAERWVTELDEGTPQPRPGWENYLAQLEQHVDAAAFGERRVYLGVRLGDRRRGWPSIRHRVEEAAGVASSRITNRELGGWRPKVELACRALAGSGLDPRPASADDLRWLVQRAFHRGLAAPPLLPASKASGGSLHTLAEGTVHNARRGLRIEQPTGERHVAFLTVARMPERLRFPGQEWLSQTDLLGPHVDASVRFRVVPARQAALAAGRKLAEAWDQARNITGVDGGLPLSLAEVAVQAEELEHSLTRDGVPLVDTQISLGVSASSADRLEAAVVDAVELYADLGIELARPSGDQLSLFVQSLPGERWRTPAYLQRMPPITLAGAMPHATVSLGDGFGPYLGHTSGRSRTPVHFDPLRAALLNHPTGVAITGAPGGGKTTLAQLLTYQMALRGAWVLTIDPKGDGTGLGGLHGLGRADVHRLGPDHAGLLDPFAVAAGSGEGAVLAIDTCRLLLPPGVNPDQEAALVTACRDAARGDDPSLLGVVHSLASHPSLVAKRLGAALEAYSDLPVASLCFAPGGAGREAVGSLDPSDALSVFTFAGLQFPAQGTPRDDFSLGDRLAVAVLHLVTALAARLADASRMQAKAIVLDEAWALTSSAQGRALVQRLARTGRSKNVALLLISQNAGDFLDEQVTNCFSAKFAFRSTQDDEVRAVLRLLGVPATADNISAIRDLGNGECVMADIDGRVGTTRIELVLPQLATAFDTTPARIGHRP
ncbi:MAG: VirB4 family type IV secretion system protein [Acidimicrobiales bacterium]